ncbi:hypothetical protein, partial [Klebsiella pneumoniae]|uniref:hypothetical protein n=1 Tax=Klebsiella pneumoniae TaxID=573 RepID=UPI00378CFA43
ASMEVVEVVVICPHETLSSPHVIIAPEIMKPMHKSITVRKLGPLRRDLTNLLLVVTFRHQHVITVRHLTVL